MDTKEAIQINVLLCLFFLTHFPKNKVYSFFGQKCYRYFDLYLNINNQVLEKKSWFKANKIHVLLLIILLKVLGSIRETLRIVIIFPLNPG